MRARGKGKDVVPRTGDREGGRPFRTEAFNQRICISQIKRQSLLQE